MLYSSKLNRLEMIINAIAYLSAWKEQVDKYIKERKGILPYNLLLTKDLQQHMDTMIEDQLSVYESLSSEERTELTRRISFQIGGKENVS